MKVLSLRVSDELEAGLRQRATELGIPYTQLLRDILQAYLEKKKDEEVNIYEALCRWWDKTCRGDPIVFEGARARAEAIGMTFDQKLYQAFLMFFDHGIL